jgi:hypothetical protein
VQMPQTRLACNSAPLAVLIFFNLMIAPSSTMDSHTFCLVHWGPLTQLVSPTSFTLWRGMA